MFQGHGSVSSFASTSPRVEAGLAARFILLFFVCPLWWGGAQWTRADEGMWLFNDLPVQVLKSRHDFEPPEGWARRLMRAAVRVSSGGSGSFVSKDGLVMTNHHVGVSALQKLSTAERNLVKEGFVARSREEELACADLSIIALMDIEDVTERVNAAAQKEPDPAARDRARREAVATIAKESQDVTGLQSDVVTLYEGGAYHLYRYRRYEDVRLVLAPETDVAFFGGDPDNFEFPRFCMDVCFFRIYQDGKPAETPNYLPWNLRAPQDGDLVFVAGHPGRTERLNTVAHLRYLRDVSYPGYLQTLARREITLQQFSLEGLEQKRIARDGLFGVQNSRKALRGMLAGLLDPPVLQAKAQSEVELKAYVAGHPDGAATLADWDNVAASFEALAVFRKDFRLLEAQQGFWSRLVGIARTLVRLADEKAKPNAQRLPGFRESDMARLEQRLYSPAPIYPEFEKAKLADSLTYLATEYGGEHPVTKMVLAGKSPGDRAAELVSGTRLVNVDYRKELATGGKEAVEACEDPIIVLVRGIEPYATAARRKYDDFVAGVRRDAYGRISKARFALRGTTVYPDATFTLRLAVGVVKGWTEEGVAIPHSTQYAGLYEKHDENDGKDPYHLPERWLRAKDELDLSLPLNFVSTPDIVGGNSGSPVINRAGELVGIIFDGNIHSLVLDLAYTERKARAVSVAAPAIVEAIRKVYGQDELANEIMGGE